MAVIHVWHPIFPAMLPMALDPKQYEQIVLCLWADKGTAITHFKS